MRQVLFHCLSERRYNLSPIFIPPNYIDGDDTICDNAYVTEADILFAAGLELEKDPRKNTQAINAYLNVIEREPTYVAAHINIGTIYYKQKKYVLAEKHYRIAISYDPRYAMARFDLGNVLDETGRVEEAIAEYKVALSLAPTYADAHYNLALAYEKSNKSTTAMKHWRAYVRLDPSSDWAKMARSMMKKAVSKSRIRLVRSNGRTRNKGTAALFIV